MVGEVVSPTDTFGSTFSRLLYVYPKFLGILSELDQFNQKINVCTLLKVLIVCRLLLVVVLFPFWFYSVVCSSVFLSLCVVFCTFY